MNKVYKFSKNLLKLTMPLSIIIGLSACSTYNYTESSGIYYDPKTDTSYSESAAQSNTENTTGIRVGTPYFDANGNGAEEFYYGDASSNENISNVNINQYGIGYGSSYLDGNLSTLRNNAQWGKNDGVNINIYNNSLWGYNSWYPYYGLNYGLGFGWGWNSGFYGPGWGWNNGYYGGGYWGWNRPWYGYYGPNWGWNSSFYGPGWGWNNGYYGGGYYGGGYYGNNWNRPPYYTNVNNARPGSRPSNGLINTNNSNENSRPGGINNTQTRPNTIGNQSINNGNTNRPIRDARPINVNPSNTNSNQGINNGNTNRPIRETRPANINPRSNNGNQGTNRPSVQSPTNRPSVQRPASTPSFNRGSSFPSSSGGSRGGFGGGSSSGGSSGGGMGSGRR